MQFIWCNILKPYQSQLVEKPDVHNRTENVLISVKYIQIQLFEADNVKHVSWGRPTADTICKYVLEQANELNWLNSIT